MSFERTKASAEDSGYAGEAPTFSGCRTYVAVMEGDDHERRMALEMEQLEQWRENLFKPKPALVHYEQLYQSEMQFFDVHRSSHFSRGTAFVADARENQIPRLNEAADRRAAADYIRTRFREWEHDRKALNDEQRASFDQDVSGAAQKRQSHPDNRQSRDTSAFYARREVVTRYNLQHDDLNEGFRHDVTSFIDRAVENQVARNRAAMDQSEAAVLDDIVRRPRRMDPDQGRER